MGSIVHWQLAVAVAIGLIVGLMATLLRPSQRHRRPGVVESAVAGIAGSLIAFYAGLAADLFQAGDIKSWFGALVGAIVLSVIYQSARSGGT